MIITINKPNKTISIHKNNCSLVHSKGISIEQLDNKEEGFKTTENQIWFSEEHFSLEKVKNFLGNVDYCKIFCQFCFKR